MRTLLIILVMGLSLGALTGCETLSALQGDIQAATKKLTDLEHEAYGDNEMRRGNQEAAFIHYSRAVKANPENLSARVKKGRILYSRELYEQALVEFEAVTAKDEVHAVALYEAGRCHFKLGDAQRAEERLSTALVHEPSLWQAHSMLGVIHSGRADFDVALGHYKAALGMRPEDGDLLNNLGVTMLMAGEYSRAEDTFRQALGSGADRAKTCNNLGLALGRQGRHDEALAAFLCAGDPARAHNNVGYILYLEGRHAQAIEHFEKAIQESPTFYQVAYDNLQRARMAQKGQVSMAPSTGREGAD